MAGAATRFLRASSLSKDAGISFFFLSLFRNMKIQDLSLDLERIFYYTLLGKSINSISATYGGEGGETGGHPRPRQGSAPLDPFSLFYFPYQAYQFYRL